MGSGTGSHGDAAVATRPKTARPRRFRVVLYNDDYTTMEFVVELLETVYRKPPGEAHALTLKVHHEGSAVAGVYPHDIAETKVLLTHELARSAGYPLRAGLEEE